MNKNKTIALLCSDNILRKQFPNGVTVLVHENPWSNTASICGSLFAGFCMDLSDKIGLSTFVSAALTTGTYSSDFMQISEYLESTGTSLSFKSGPHAINFKGNCLCEDIGNLLRLIKEILEEPAFPEQYIEVLRQRALEDYDLDLDDSEGPAQKTFQRILWREDHPYGHSGFEDDETIQSITRNDLLDFHRRFFGPNTLIIALVGGFNSQKIMEYCEELFGSWEKTQEDVDEDTLFPDITREKVGIRCHINLTSRKELSLILGTYGPDANDPNILSARLGNCILGKFDLTGRIGRVVREENGLAYSVYSALDPRKKGGSWFVAAGIAPENLIKVSEMIIDELKRFTTEPVDSKELEYAKSWFIGSQSLDFGSNAEKAYALHNLEFHQRDLDHYLHIRKQIDMITPETVLEAAHKWIDPDKMILITAGPRDENSPQDGYWWPTYA